MECTKNRHLSKPMVVCTPNGKIVDIYGLFPAKQNDATIIKTVLKSNKELRRLLKPGDHIIVDRGFRDASKTFENKYHLTVHMPACKTKKQNQLNTDQLNKSRFVTKVRYMVEKVNGTLTNPFRANKSVHRNVTLSHALDDYRITGAIINRFFTLHTANSNDINVAT